MEPIENLLWYEFLRYNRASFEFLEGRMKRAVNVAEKLGAANRLVQQMSGIATCKIPFAIGLMSEMEKEMLAGKRIDPELHWNFQHSRTFIESEYSEVTALLLQRFFHKASQSPVKESRDNHTEWLRQGAKYFKTPDQSTAAVMKILDNCYNALYGQRRNAISLLEPMVVYWLYYYYRFLPPSRTICMPSRDQTNLCHWAYLAHETFHSKLFNISDARADRESALQSKKTEKVARCNRILSNLLSIDYEDTISQWDILEERFVKAMQKGLANEYELLYKELLQDTYRIPKRFLQLQFREFLCDMGANKIAGPCNTMLSACMSADNLRYPALDVLRHIFDDIAHPPDSVRVSLQILNLRQSDLVGEEIDDIVSLVEELKQVDLKCGPKGIERDTVRFIDRYIGILTQASKGEASIFCEITKLVDSLLDHVYCYSDERWARVVTYYENLDTLKMKRHSLFPYDYVNIVWLKLLEISKRAKCYHDYVDAYADAEPVLRGLWDELMTSNVPIMHACTRK